MRDFEVCKKAALSGDVQAQFDLGDMYSQGQDGVIQDYAESLKWFSMAAAVTPVMNRVALTAWPSIVSIS